MNSNPALISLENIAIEFPKQEGSGVIRIVNGLSFQLPKGDIACLLGPSGCGKSTILRAICGFEPVQMGEIKIHGKTVSSPGIRVPPAERKVGMVFQDFALFPHLSVLENVMFGLRTGTTAERERVGALWLERVALADKASAYPHELSGGQQQRVALARAMAPNPISFCSMSPFPTWILICVNVWLVRCAISLRPMELPPFLLHTINLKRSRLRITLE